MLIKVFGQWINPDQVTGIVEWDDLEYTVKAVSLAGGWYFKDKTGDEVAEEINRQITATSNGQEVG